MSRVLVKQDGDAVDGAAALEVVLDLLRGGTVVNIANEDAARVNVLSAFALALRALVVWVVGLLVIVLHLR